MSKMTSIAEMIQLLHEYSEITELSDWETGFISSVYKKTNKAQDTSFLSEKQVDKIDELFARYREELGVD